MHATTATRRDGRGVRIVGVNAAAWAAAFLTSSSMVDS
jgi:hypothetical protein